MKIIILLLTLLVTNVFAEAEISKATIKKWLASEHELEVERVVPIWLSNGEKGLIAALNIPNICRTCWANYALVRPQHKQAKMLSEKDGTQVFGGQYNGIRIISDGSANEPSIVELGSAGTGQGYSHESRTWVSFNAWQLVKHYELETSHYSNSGTCGKSFEFPDEDFGQCKATQVFLNLLETNPLQIVKTTVISEGDTLESMTSTLSAEIITP